MTRKPFLKHILQISVTKQIAKIKSLFNYEILFYKAHKMVLTE